MTATISVRVEGPVGLDEPEELRAELARETALQWRLEAADEERDTLDGGTAAALLMAVLTSATGAVVQAAAQRAIDAWRERRLDPPTVTVVVVQADQRAELPEEGADGTDGEPPALPEGS
ncbi:MULTISPECIES: hypothetical protein [unclassified Streptomyces]|uniref:hypothetical protein n=1 Tax=unclassified Streptomyces TaxID=2593676 RepID=UPI000DB9F4D0|nr:MULTISPECIES: hypothetical protein [unclassified Streptomyces]MYT75407.1 hypothetical protein [Streptomyces sp. SID8367]RAJ86809.1 hypothetical protein K377_02489 [Streptomyces sp. PsTaAH-137]